MIQEATAALQLTWGASVVLINWGASVVLINGAALCKQCNKTRCLFKWNTVLTKGMVHSTYAKVACLDYEQNNCIFSFTIQPGVTMINFKYHITIIP